MSEIKVSKIESLDGTSPIIFDSGLTFSTPLKMYVGTTSQIDALSGLEGQIAFDTTLKKLKAHDGTNFVIIGDTVNTFDTIVEATTGSGVSIDGVLLKDGIVTTNEILEFTSNTGVTIDGVKLKDSQVNTDTINEKISGAGVTVDSVLLKDGGATFSSDVVPDTTDTVNLGSATKRWNAIYLNPSSLYLGTQHITADTTNVYFPGKINTTAIEEAVLGGGIDMPHDITFSGSLDATAATKIGFPTGAFYQVVSTFTETEATFAAPNADPGVEVTDFTTDITPSQANSKILIMLNLFGEAGHHDMVGYISRTEAGQSEVKLKPTAITGQRGSFHVGWYNDQDYNSTPHTTHYHMIDSPQTTNTVTYKVYLAKTSGGTTNFRLNGTINTTTSLNYEKGHSTLTLMEILA